jgi:hypothetical protein
MAEAPKTGYARLGGPDIFGIAILRCGDVGAALPPRRTGYGTS